MADVLTLAKNSLYGNGSLTSSAPRLSSISSNINAAYGASGITPTRKVLLDQAKAALNSGNTQEAALRLWYILGSTGQRPIVPRQQAQAQPAQKAASQPTATSKQLKEFAVRNQLRKAQGLAPVTLEQFLGKPNPQSAIPVTPASPNTGGYTVTMSHAQQNEFVRRNQTRKAQGKTALSEDEFRREKGLPTTRSASIKYVAPKLHNNSNSGSGTGKSVTTVTTKKAQQKAAPKVKVDPKNTKLKIIPALNPGQIRLKDGSVIDQVQKQGARVGKGKEQVTVYASRDAYNIAKADQNKAAQESKKEAKKQREAYKPVLSKSGYEIAAIQTKGGLFKTGEKGVQVIKVDKKTGKVTAASKTATEYKSLEKIAAKNKQDRLNFKINSNVLDFGKNGEVILLAQQKDFKDVKPFRTVNQIKGEKAAVKAVAEAKKIRPNAPKEYYEGVANVARRNAIGTRAVLKEDWDHANKQVAKKVVLPVADQVGKIINARDAALAGTSISINEKGKWSVTKAGKEILKGKNVQKFNAKDVHRQAVLGNIVLSGYNQFLNDEVNEIKTRPLTYGVKQAGYYVGGAAFGAGLQGVKIASKAGLGKAAVKVANPAAKKTLNVLSKHIGGLADLGLLGGLAVSTGLSEVEYQKTRSEMSKEEKALYDRLHAANYFHMGKEFAVGGLGFNKGARGMDAAYGKYKTMRTPAGKKIQSKADFSKLPAEYDIMNIKTPAKPAQPRTIAQKITSLKRQVVSLERKGRPADKAKAKGLKRVIRAFETKAKNEKAKISIGKSPRADIKEIAEIQAFDKELASLRDMKQFADTWMSPRKPSTVNPEEALSMFSKSELKIINEMKTGTSRAEANKAAYQKAHDRILTERATKKKGPLTAAQKKAKTIHDRANKRIQKAKAKKVNPSARSVTNSKSATQLRAKLKLQAEARRISSRLEKARVEVNIKQEAYWLGKAAEFRIKNGVSVAKASKLNLGKELPQKSLGKKRADYAAHETLRAAKKSRRPASQTKKPQKAANRLLKDARKAKEQESLPSDITNVRAYASAKNAPVRLTIKDIALFKAKSGDKYPVNRGSSKSWESLKKAASEYNSKAEQKRELTARNKKLLAEIAEKYKDEGLSPEQAAKLAKEELQFKEWEKAQIKRSQAREAERAHKETKESKALEDAHYNAWEKSQVQKSKAKEIERELKNSPEYAARQKRYENAREKLLQERSKARELKKAERAKRIAEHEKARERIQQERAVRRALQDTVKELDAISSVNKPKANPWKVAKESGKYEEYFGSKKSRPSAQLTYEPKGDFAKFEQELAKSKAQKQSWNKKAKPENKAEQAVKRAKTRNEEIRKSYGEGVEVRSGNLRVLQKVKALEKAEKLEKVTANKKQKKRALTAAEKRILASRVKAKVQKPKSKIPKVGKRVEVKTYRGTFYDDPEPVRYPKKNSTIPRGPLPALMFGDAVAGFNKFNNPVTKGVEVPTGIRTIPAGQRNVTPVGVKIQTPSKSGIGTPSKVGVSTPVKISTPVKVNITVPVKIATPVALKPIEKVLEELASIAAPRTVSLPKYNPWQGLEVAPLPPKRAKKLATAGLKPKKGNAKLSRDIKNKLGSLNTFFGESPKPKRKARKSRA